MSIADKCDFIRSRSKNKSPNFISIIMSSAVFKTGGKQYRVSKGDVIEVEKLKFEVGDTASFDEVLALGEGADIKLGSPTVEGATVEAKVVEQFRGKKIVAFKFKRRQGYHKTTGFRRSLTRLEITEIKGA